MGIRKREQSSEKGEGKRDGSGDKAADRDIKKKKDAVILAHYYVDGEVQEIIADYVGDSYYLLGAGDDSAAEDDHFLWRVIYGRVRRF